MFSLGAPETWRCFLCGCFFLPARSMSVLSLEHFEEELGIARYARKRRGMHDNWSKTS